MISYKPFYKTLENRGITQYKLQNELNISRATLSSLKHNRNITLFTIEKLCKLLDCTPLDIFEILDDEVE